MLISTSEPPLAAPVKAPDVAGLETLYGVLLVGALVLNGIAIAGNTPLSALFEPVREGRLLGRIVALDLLIVPAVVVGTATLLGVGPVGLAGLVIVSAASSGPIGMALTRIAGGDVPLSVTLVVGLGMLNLVTVPLVTWLLLPAGITIPITSLMTSLAGLAVAPLLIGRLFARVTQAARLSGPTVLRILAGVRRTGDALLLGAIATALLLEPSEVLEALTGPVLIVAVVAMLAISLTARLVTSDPRRVRTVAITVNARAIGLALTLATLHLGDVAGLRAVILAYGGLTQMVPVLTVLLLARRAAARRS